MYNYCGIVKAVLLLKPGGVLVYSTCTITVEENEAMVAWAVRTFSQQLQLVEQVTMLTMMFVTSNVVLVVIFLCKTIFYHQHSSVVYIFAGIGL